MSEKQPNALINESSPYLLQHAYNPVQWQAWHPSAFEQAQKENKLVLISIGYAACHWCHVMEKQCFEDESIADIMNTHFVCIKVDREERPDIDHIYMSAVQLIQGQGGWPLNCFALPNGQPVFGGTFFPPQQWRQVLEQLHSQFAVNPEAFYAQAKELTQHTQQSLGITPSSHVPHGFTKDHIKAISQQMRRAFDTQEGGFGKAPKFPLPVALEFLLWYGKQMQDRQVFDFVERSLDKMARGGIYDQLGGGFARYAVDAIWKVPHFEKMLYDNAQLISLYSLAYKMTKKPLYKHVIAQSAAFVSQELTNDDGVFYSALDADSEGEEGKYYVWTYDEIIEHLGEEAGQTFCEQFGVSPQGNWEGGKNILIQTAQAAPWRQGSKVLIDKLLNQRAQRIKPALDDKILTAWNAMMVQAYVDAYTAIGTTTYIEAATKAAHFIWEYISDGKGKLYRSYKNGTAKIHAFLEDYAHLMRAYTSLYQVTFQKVFLDRAALLIDYAIQHFWNPTYHLFRYSANTAEKLIATQMEVNDNVIPASNSVMAHNLHTLGYLLSNEDYIHKAKVMLQTVFELLEDSSVYMANWDLLLLKHIIPHQEVVIMGQDHIAKSIAIQQDACFNTIFAGGTHQAYLPIMKHRENEAAASLIYVCKGAICQAPTTSLDKAKAALL